MYSMKDFFIIALQFLYAFGGLILIGTLAYKLLKSQTLINDKRLRFERDFDEELQSQCFEQDIKHGLERKPSAIPQKASTIGKPSVVPTPKHYADEGSPRGPKKRRFQQEQRKYHLATRLASRGLSVADIRRRVLLPECELELITRITNKISEDRWQNHLSMIEAIESG